jgi:hypothetical protein
MTLLVTGQYRLHATVFQTVGTKGDNLLVYGIERLAVFQELEAQRELETCRYVQNPGDHRRRRSWSLVHLRYGTRPPCQYLLPAFPLQGP